VLCRMSHLFALAHQKATRTCSCPLEYAEEPQRSSRHFFGLCRAPCSHSVVYGLCYDSPPSRTLDYSSTCGGVSSTESCDKTHFTDSRSARLTILLQLPSSRSETAMRLPALDGQSQPIASTSGRCDEPLTTYFPSMRGRERGAVLRRALIAPILSPVLASGSRNERKLCISSTSSNKTQGTRLESPQVPAPPLPGLIPAPPPSHPSPCPGLCSLIILALAFWPADWQSLQVVESKSASNAIPEYWTRHLKKIRKGDERRMKRYSLPFLARHQQRSQTQARCWAGRYVALDKLDL